MNKNKNRELLLDFIEYCAENPEQRFWQALRNWCGKNFIWAGDDVEGCGMEYTFNRKGKNK